jgi:hypothetical protein
MAITAEAFSFIILGTSPRMTSSVGRSLAITLSHCVMRPGVMAFAEREDLRSKDSFPTMQTRLDWIPDQVPA